MSDLKADSEMNEAAMKALVRYLDAHPELPPLFVAGKTEQGVGVRGTFQVYREEDGFGPLYRVVYAGIIQTDRETAREARHGA